MATASEAVAVARSQVGYTSRADPEPGSRYGRWYARVTDTPYFGMTGVPWCAMFASWALDRAGVRCAGAPGASCTSMMGAAKRAGAWVPRDALRRGDLVLFDWEGDGSPDHVGIVDEPRATYVHTVEGNTSPGTAGSQGNGGGVWERDRGYGYILGGIRPEYDDEEAEVVTDQDVKRIAEACAQYVYGDSDRKRNLNQYNAAHWGFGYAEKAYKLLVKVAAKLGVK